MKIWKLCRTTRTNSKRLCRHSPERLPDRTADRFILTVLRADGIPPKESIREIRINQNPFSAEFDRLGFGRIEILTKPGSDKFRGQAFFNFNDESLNSRNPFALNRAPTQTRFYGGNLSGPIIKNKASFFLDVSNRDIDNGAAINAIILDPSFNIIPFTQEFRVPTRRFEFSPRLDYAINDKNTLVARYSFNKAHVIIRASAVFRWPGRAFQFGKHRTRNTVDRNDDYQSENGQRDALSIRF